MLLSVGIGYATPVWIQQSSGTDFSLFSVDFISDSEGWISGGNGYQGLILHTLNGGETWEAQTIGTTFNLFDTDPAIIPEPTTICLMGFGILGLLGIGIRQRRKDR